MGAAAHGPVPFARNPALATPGIINMRSKEGIKPHGKGTKSLHLDPEKRFCGEVAGLFDFLESLSHKACNFGWTRDPGGILMIPGDPVDPAVGTPVNLLTSFGLRTHDQVSACEETFCNSPTRRSQDSDMLFECIMNSLSDVGQNKVNLHKTKFIINGTPCGVLLLKVLIQVSAIDTNATVSSIRSQMGDLHACIIEVGCDTVKFNEHAVVLWRSCFNVARPRPTGLQTCSRHAACCPHCVISHGLFAALSTVSR